MLAFIAVVAAAALIVGFAFYLVYLLYRAWRDL